MATVTKSLKITKNYHTLRNPGSDIIVINTLIPPDGVKNGFLLWLRWDENTKGGGCFIKNRTGGIGNMNLEAKTLGGSGEFAMTSKSTQNSGTSSYKHILGHITDALAAIVAADNTARNNAVTAAQAALVTTAYDPTILIRNGSFAYGLGGATFLNGIGRKDTKDGVDYYDYSNRKPRVALMYHEGLWEQVMPVSLDAIS